VHGKKFIIIDEFKINIALTDLLKLLDQRVIEAPIKGSHGWWDPWYIIITTNRSPWEWYTYNDRDWEREALFRRIHETFLFQKNPSRVPRPEELDINDRNVFEHILPTGKKTRDDFSSYRDTMRDRYQIRKYREYLESKGEIVFDPPPAPYLCATNTGTAGGFPIHVDPLLLEPKVRDESLYKSVLDLTFAATTRVGALQPVAVPVAAPSAAQPQQRPLVVQNFNGTAVPVPVGTLIPAAQRVPPRVPDSQDSLRKTVTVSVTPFDDRKRDSPKVASIATSSSSSSMEECSSYDSAMELLESHSSSSDVDSFSHYAQPPRIDIHSRVPKDRFRRPSPPGPSLKRSKLNDDDQSIYVGRSSHRGIHL